MMIKNVLTLKLILIVFLGITFEAHAQGPNAPEAAAFEPVDATDMVNLVTGNMSYVLPLLSVPSPEGGYPLALSYHSGIAMDQESGWVGLGWNLNPGAINRRVNGYPDDWGKTEMTEFFYDKGWNEKYYSFSIGASISNSFSVGLGVSWGSNQSLGGYVEASIGLGGESGVSIGGSIGSNGVGLSGGYGNFSASISTNGVGLGYGSRGSTSLGVNLNYNYNSGLSGGVSVSEKNGKFKNGVVKKTGLGISFSSRGASMNMKISGYGAGISNSSSSISSSDYSITESSSGFNLPLGIFYTGYSKTSVKYSLFMRNSSKTSGILYPYKSVQLRNLDPRFNRTMWVGHFMDVNIKKVFYNNSEYEDLIDGSKENNNMENHLVLPNYDKYIVTAQGLSGNISPFFETSFNLSGRGYWSDKKKIQYLNKPYVEYKGLKEVTGATPRQIDRNYFTFTDKYNSFLRIKEGNLPSNLSKSTLNGRQLLSNYMYPSSKSFKNLNSLNNRKKREGNIIVTYTNKEIRKGGIKEFIEAKKGSSVISRRDKKIFLDEGIGAFQITALDGKTYHYSLPVYQYESIYKNFKKVNGRGDDVSSEDDNFFEITKNTPYATHWLLTAITGPDYVDSNEDGKLNRSDYGYWVEFDYGKWSDGFVWQIPNGRVEETVSNKISRSTPNTSRTESLHSTSKTDNKDKTFSYTIGRKQVYYLDAIRTRTHTALFIKGFRDDNISKERKKNNGKTWNSGHFDIVKYANRKKSDKYYHLNVKLGDTIYNINEKVTKVTSLVPIANDLLGNMNRMQYYNYKKEISLRLEKIILLQNARCDEDLAYRSYDNLSSESSIYSEGVYYDLVHSRLRDRRFYKKLPISKYFSLHQSENVLDVNDIKKLNLENKADQVIEFEYDYSLAKGAPNTPSGRLALKKVYFNGKSNNKLIPPYKFNYGANYLYNKNDIDDWGYNKNNPAAWSMNEIVTPTGGKVKIDYESDKYDTESYYKFRNKKSASYHYGSQFRNDILNINNSTGEVTLKDGLSSKFKVGEYYTFRYIIADFFRNGLCGFNGANCNRGRGGSCRDNYEMFKVISKRGNVIKFKGLKYSELINPKLCSVDIYYFEDSDDRYVRGGAKTNSGNVEGVKEGGIRTKSITVNDGINDIATTEYVYKEGITSYAPSKEPKGVPYISELPAPMVLYGEVEMRTKNGKGKHLGKTVYNFETLKPRGQEEGYIFSLGECFRVKENQNITFENGKVIANKYTIESRLGNIGRINSVRSYNSLGQLMNYTKNNYKQNLDSDGEIGVTQETHSSYKRVRKNDKEKFYVSSTSKVNYPSVLKSVEQTAGGVIVTKHFDKYDFLTGEILETRTYASDGKAFKTKILPAYEKYSKMSSKADNINNKNMLSQVAGNYNYIYKNGKWSPTGASITTWNNNWIYRSSFNDEKEKETIKSNNKVWRKHKTYVWNGSIDKNGIYTSFSGNEDNFNWGLGATQRDLDWKEISEITLYNHYSEPLEVRINSNINSDDNYVSTKMNAGYDNEQRIIATCNSKYTEMYYTGVENITGNGRVFEGGVSMIEELYPTTNPINFNTKKFHTGKMSVAVKPSVNSFQVVLKLKEHRTGRYKLSVWVDKGNESKARVSVNGVIKSFNGEKVYAGNWVFLTHYEDLDKNRDYKIGIRSASGTLYADDFRLHPINSKMISYVYNKWDEVSYIIGANGLATHYKYDDAGRLKEIWTEVADALGVIGGFKLVKKHSYNYKK